MNIRLIVILFALLLLAACNHRSDTAVRKNLPGTWHVDDGSPTHTFTVAPNGDCVDHSVVGTPDTGTQTVETDGTVEVKDGFLIHTITKSSRTNATVPLVLRARIIRADDREMVINPEGTKDNIVLRKDTK